MKTVLLPLDLALLMAIWTYEAMAGEGPSTRLLTAGNYLNETITRLGIPTEGTSSNARVSKCALSLREAGLIKEAGKYEMTEKGVSFVRSLGDKIPLSATFQDGTLVETTSYDNEINFRDIPDSF